MKHTLNILFPTFFLFLALFLTNQNAYAETTATRLQISNYPDFRQDNLPGDIGSPTITIDDPDGYTIDWTLPTFDAAPEKHVYIYEAIGDQYTYYGVDLSNGQKTTIAGATIQAEMPKKTVKATVIINGQDQEVDINNPQDITVRLDGTEGQAQTFNIPFVKEYSNGEIERSAFTIDYQPNASPNASPTPASACATCHYTQEVATSVCASGVQLVYGSGCEGASCEGCTYVPGCSPEPACAGTSSPPPTSQCTEIKRYNICIECDSSGPRSEEISEDSCGNYKVTIDSQPDNACDYLCPKPTGKTIKGWECDNENNIFTLYSDGTRSISCHCGDNSGDCGGGADLTICQPKSPTGQYTSDAECVRPVTAASTPPAGRTLTGWYCVGNNIWKEYSDGFQSFECSCGNNWGDCGNGTNATICQSDTPPYPYTKDARCVEPAAPPPPPPPPPTCSESPDDFLQCGGTCPDGRVIDDHNTIQVHKGVDGSCNVFFICNEDLGQRSGECGNP